MRLFQKSQFPLIESALHRLTTRNVELCFTAQNLGEFWRASTRPLERNGFGLSVAETELRARFIEQSMTLLSANEKIYNLWRNLLLAHEVRGVQVHDAHLDATLEVHEVRHLLTFNGGDFKRFAFVIPVHPQDVASYGHSSGWHIPTPFQSLVGAPMRVGGSPTRRA